MNKTGKKQIAGNNWIDKLLANPSNPYKIIFLACVLAYGQILSFGLVYFDDHGFVLLGSNILKLSNIPEFFKHSVFWVMGDSTQEHDIFYRPLQNVIYALCNTLAPERAWIYHVAGLSFHVVAACILFRFFTALKYHASLSLLFALIYSVHPVLVQGVAWIAGIGDQMATIFSLLSAIFFIGVVSDKKRSISEYLTAHFMFLTAAMFSKEISIGIIPLCLFYGMLVVKSKAAKSPIFLLSLGWITIVTVYFFARNQAIPPAHAGLFSSLIGSFRTNGLLVLEYFEKIFLPYRLSPIPSREDAQLLAGAVIFITFVCFLIYKKRITRLSVFGTLWFVVFLFPTFIQQNPQSHFFAFEHRLYLPFIGIIIVVMEGLNIKQVNINSGVQKYGFAFALLLFSAVTISHSRTFKDPYTFYDKAISSSPQSVIAYNGYGKLLLKDNKYAEAIEAFKKSFEYKPDDMQTTGKIAEIYLKNLNNPEEAIVWFKKTLAIAPNSIEAAVSIGDAYFNFMKDTANAVTWYNNGLKIQPDNEFALANLGVIYASKGKYTDARSYFTKSLTTNAKNLLALKWLAISYFNEGQIAEAVNYLNKAYKNYPADVDLQRNLMICYYKLNDRGNTEKFASLYLQSKNPIPEEIEKYLESN